MKLEFFLFFIPLCVAFEGSEISFLRDFTKLETTGRIRVCNFIVCSASNSNAKLAKEVSSNYQCAISIRNTHENILDWYRSSHLQFFGLDLSCPKAENVLAQANELKLFQMDYFWLILNSKLNVEDVFNKLNILIISQIYVGFKDLDRFQLFSFYKRDPWNYPIKEVIGNWDEKTGVNFSTIRSPAVRRENMEGRLFTAAMVVS